MCVDDVTSSEAEEGNNIVSLLSLFISSLLKMRSFKMEYQPFSTLFFFSPPFRKPCSIEGVHWQSSWCSYIVISGCPKSTRIVVEFLSYFNGILDWVSIFSILSVSL